MRCLRNKKKKISLQTNFMKTFLTDIDLYIFDFMLI